VFGEEGDLAAVQVTRRTYLVAMRLRHGLPVAPACLVAAEESCAHGTAAGARCGVRLDTTGHHAVACGAGGGFVRRHNGVVWELARQLRRLGFGVRTEVWLDDLAEIKDGRVREARMDLVVTSPFGTYYLDVTVFHPFTRLGARRLPSAGGSLAAQEQRKRERYVVRDPASGTRRTRAHFVPIALASYGALGPAAVELFGVFELAARRSLHVSSSKRVGWLARAVAAAAVHGAAAGVLSAFAPPDGQERAHLRGLAAPGA